MLEHQTRQNTERDGGFVISFKSICVYCGSQPGNNPAFINAARVLGKAMADNAVQLVYGGGTRGIMGEVAKAVAKNGGAVVGIIPRFLIDREASIDVLEAFGEVVITNDMHERKHTMFNRADAFVALPGGIGTLEEIVEIMTWAQLGRHRKPMVFANIEGFWDPMLRLIDHMEEAGFLHSRHLVRPLVVDDPADIVEKIMAKSLEAADHIEGDSGVIERM